MEHDTKRVVLILLFIFVVAFVVRFIAADNSHILTDETSFAVKAIHFLSSGMYSTLDQVPLHLALVDISERIFGVSGWSSRLPNIIFGAAAIFLIFLIVRQFGDKKWALLAAFLFALSPYSILFNIETDMTAIFFLLFSVFFYIKALHDLRYLKHSLFFLGLAALAKMIALFILPAYLIGLLYVSQSSEQNIFIRYKEKRIQIQKQGLKKVGMAILLLLLGMSPILIYNFLLYLHKGLVDLIFARSLGITVYDQYFGNSLRSWSFASNIDVLTTVVKRLWTFDAFIFVGFLLGSVFTFLHKKKENFFFMITIFMIAFLLSGTSGTSKSHYIFIIPFLAIIASYGILQVAQKLRFPQALSILIAVALLLSSYTLYHNKFHEHEGVLELREETIKFEKNALVIVDSRLYNGNIAWNFHDTHYLESQYFPQLQQIMKNEENQLVSAPIYFIECVNDDCGWGRGIKENQEVQGLNEQLVDLFRKDALSMIEVPGKQYSFTIYKVQGKIPANTFEVIEDTHQFFFYSVGWEDMTKNFDYYEITSFPLKVIDFFGLILLYGAILCAFWSLYLLYTLTRTEVKRE